MSTTSQNVTGGRCRSSVSRFIGTTLHVSRCADLVGPAEMLRGRRTDCVGRSARRDLDHLGNAMDAHDVRAGEHRRRDGGGGGPIALGRRQRPRWPTSETTCARGPTGWAGRARQTRRACASAARLCAAFLAKPKPGIDHEPVPTRRRTRSRARCCAAARGRCPRGPHRRSALRRTCRATGRACASGPAPRPARATTSPRPASYPSPLMSLTIATPSSRARSRGLGAVGVDRDRNAQPAGQPLSTGSRRRHSSAASTGSAPGRVDSAPMSMMSAPSASIASARSMARAGSRRPAVRERIRRDVEHAHDERASAELQRVARSGRGNERRRRSSRRRQAALHGLVTAADVPITPG